MSRKFLVLIPLLLCLAACSDQDQGQRESKSTVPTVRADFANAKTWTLWLTQEESVPHLAVPNHWSALGTFDTESACHSYGQKLVDQLGQLPPRKGYSRGTAAMTMVDTRRGGAHDDIQHAVQTTLYCTPDDSVPGPPWKHLATLVEDSAELISAKEQYELSQECAKFAAESWSKTADMRTSLASDPEKVMLSSYTNHYNSKLNKCLAIMTTDIIPKEKGTKTHGKSLFDLYENREIASFLSSGMEVMGCKALHKSCESESQWDAPVKPYMEE